MKLLLNIVVEDFFLLYFYVLFFYLGLSSQEIQVITGSVFDLYESCLFRWRNKVKIYWFDQDIWLIKHVICDKKNYRLKALIFNIIRGTLFSIFKEIGRSPAQVSQNKVKNVLTWSKFLEKMTKMSSSRNHLKKNNKWII